MAIPIKKRGITFQSLISSIKNTHQQCFVQATKAVNVGLTIRNWIIGYYIEEYERVGVDRARYGERLMESLADILTKQGIAGCDRRGLYRHRQFYLIYPQIVESVTPQWIGQQELIVSQKVGSVTPQLVIPGKKLIEALSFTHLAELIEIDDPWKRAFYEHECMRANWSVRELKRQIATLYFERSGLSRNKKKLTELILKKIEVNKPEFVMRDPYVFEFVGIKSKEVMGESHMEDALLDRLQDFLLELGHGFCFESRQQRINIGGEYCFIDLVFYHRLLKCHILIELKADTFKHEHVSQLNTYVSWYRKNVMTTGDNPPVGILLCTGKNHAMVEYALAGMDNSLFVKKNQLELPKKKEIEIFLESQIKEKVRKC